MTWRVIAALAAKFLFILTSCAVIGCEADQLAEGPSPDASVTPDASVGPKLPSSCKVNNDCNGNGISPVCQTTYSCIQQQCVVIPGGPLFKKDGTPCSDESLCSTGDQCSKGVCVGDPQICGDNNDCTSDSCDPASGCVNTAIQVVCDDGDDCTKGDSCKEGNCVSSSALDCNDENPCTTDSCDPANGCLNTNNALACTDGNACTQDDACKDGACGGMAKVCDDGNPCTADSCDVIKGCMTTPNPIGTACSDGDSETVLDVCNASSDCIGKQAAACEVDTDCAGLEVNACATYVCDTLLGLCKPQGKPLEDDNNPCTLEGCNPATGATTHQPLNVSCDDGNPCSVGDFCKEGACTNGVFSLNCDDGNACTNDSCTPSIGCVVMDKPCNDSNVHTSDSCNPKWGCQFTPQYLTVNCIDNPKISDTDVAAVCTVTTRFSLVQISGAKVFTGEQNSNNWAKLPMSQVCSMMSSGYVLVVKATQYLAVTGQPILTDFPPFVQSPNGGIIDGVMDVWSDPLVTERIIALKDMGSWCQQ